MDMESTLTTILENAQREVMNALAKAANEGDVEAVDSARRLVGELRAAAAELIERPQTTRHKAGLSAAKNGASKRKRASSDIKEKKQRDRTYPEFFVRHATLYRRAWSRKKRSEYEHKVPRQTVDEVVRAMCGIAAAETKPVSVESILAKVNRSSSVSIPQYQVYLVVSWLRHAQQIEQVGRDGYQIPPDIAQKAVELWQQLELRSAKNGRQ